jgi:hypothetical protein
MEKYFNKSEYFCVCIKLGIDSLKISTDINKNEKPDCIIIDDTISPEDKNEILKVYQDITVLYIPALTEVTETSDKEKRYIPEPFKLSELDKRLRELYEKIHHS